MVVNFFWELEIFCDRSSSVGHCFRLLLFPRCDGAPIGDLRIHISSAEFEIVFFFCETIFLSFEQCYLCRRGPGALATIVEIRPHILDGHPRRTETCDGYHEIDVVPAISSMSTTGIAADRIDQTNCLVIAQRTFWKTAQFRGLSDRIALRCVSFCVHEDKFRNLKYFKSNISHTIESSDHEGCCKFGRSPGIEPESRAPQAPVLTFTPRSPYLTHAL